MTIGDDATRLRLVGPGGTPPAILTAETDAEFAAALDLVSDLALKARNGRAVLSVAVSAFFLRGYVNEFAGRKNQRDLDTVEQLAELFDGFIGKRLRYRDQIAFNGLRSGSRSGW